MDRLKTDINGGSPFDLPDLEFLQDSIETHINILGNILSKHNAILKGCEVRSGQVYPGFVYLNGELLLHEGTRIAGLNMNDDVWWTKEETDTEEVRTELGKKAKIWKLKRAVPHDSGRNGGVRLEKIQVMHTSEAYRHPGTHPLSIVTDTGTYVRMTRTERKKLVGIEENANKYEHPTHTLDEIKDTASLVRMTKGERDKLEGIAKGANKYDPPQYTLDDINDSGDYVRMKKTERDFLSKLVPRGMIAMWTGTAAPEGWALCDGTKGTPDLRGRFIVGVGPGYNIKDTGGEKEVELNQDHIPRHGHGYTVVLPYGSKKAGNGKYTEKVEYINGDSKPSHSTTWHSHNGRSGTIGGEGMAWEEGKGKPNFYPEYTERHVKTTNFGLGNSHENRPPYYALAYIMKL